MHDRDMTGTVCILCKTGAYTKRLYSANITEKDLHPTIFSARRRPDHIHGEILRCNNCGLVYTKERLNAEKLSQLYASSEYTYQAEEKHITRTYERYLRRLLPLLREQPRPWSYLDIGCGNGFMLSVAQQLGFESVFGVEPSADAMGKADPALRSSLIQGMFSSDLTGKNRFDALTCFQTLDHIQDPVTFVRECLVALKPGGAVLFINHNIASLPACLLGERCPMIDIAHTYLHTKKTMLRLFNDAGFRDIAVFSVRNDYPLSYWAHLLPGPKKLKDPVMTLLKKLGIGNIVLPLYAGNLGLLARKPLSP